MSENKTLAVLDKIATPEEYEIILKSGAIPSSLDTPQKLMTVVQMGKELGMQPMTAISNINIIKGRAVIASAMLGALLKNRVDRYGNPAPVEFEYTKDYVVELDADGDEKIITELELTYISEVTKNVKTLRHSISWGQMELAGYTTKDNWAKYPKEMMRARCMAYAVRALFPEILLGKYIDTEIVDSLDNDEEYRVDMTEDGDVVVLENNK